MNIHNSAPQICHPLNTTVESWFEEVEPGATGKHTYNLDQIPICFCISLHKCRVQSPLAAVRTQRGVFEISAL